MNDYYLNKEIGSYLSSLVLTRQHILLAAYQFKGQVQFSYLAFRDKVSSFYEHLKFNNEEIFKHMNKTLEENDVNRAYYIDALNNIYIGQKIFERDTAKHAATIVLKLDKKYLMRKYVEMLDGAIEAVHVGANNKAELVTIGNLNDKRKEKLIDFMEMNLEPDMVYKEENNKQAVIYNTFSTHNLRIGNAVYISIDLLLADIRALSRFIFMLCISILPIFLLLANKLYKEVIYPVYLLSDKMQQIEKGEMGVQIKGDYGSQY